MSPLMKQWRLRVITLQGAIEKSLILLSQYWIRDNLISYLNTLFCITLTLIHSFFYSRLSQYWTFLFCTHICSNRFFSLLKGIAEIFENLLAFTYKSKKEKAIKKRSKEMSPLIKQWRLRVSNFTGSNREKSDIAVAILDKGQLNFISKSIVLHYSDSNPFFIYSYLWQFYHICIYEWRRNHRTFYTRF